MIPQIQLIRQWIWLLEISFTIFMCKSLFFYIYLSLSNWKESVVTITFLVTVANYTCLWNLSVGSFLDFRAWTVRDSCLGLCMIAFLFSRLSNPAQIPSRLIFKVHSIFSNKKLPFTFGDNPNNLYCLRTFFLNSLN